MNYELIESIDIENFYILGDRLLDYRAKDAHRHESIDCYRANTEH